MKNTTKWSIITLSLWTIFIILFIILFGFGFSSETNKEVPCYDYNNNVIEGDTCISNLRELNGFGSWFSVLFILLSISLIILQLINFFSLFC